MVAPYVPIQNIYNHIIISMAATYFCIPKSCLVLVTIFKPKWSTQKKYGNISFTSKKAW